jgi:hypothetical protein
LTHGFIIIDFMGKGKRAYDENNGRKDMKTKK